MDGQFRVCVGRICDAPTPPHLARILDLARWAPSGDNTQPWRFEILGDAHVLVHGLDTREHVVYDLDGHASQLAHGALLETLAVAATLEGLRVGITRRPDTPETHLLYDVRFTSDPSIQPDPLARFIEKRVVQRRAMSTRALSAAQKQALQAALPAGWRVHWFEGLAWRWRLARFTFDSAKIRLIMPEAYLVHRDIIEWGARFSEDRIPERAVGVDPLTGRFMHWAMTSWRRVDRLNRWFLGDLPPRIQLDLVPGLACAAHFALIAPYPLRENDDYVAAGRAMQRYWLTASAQGLYLQPEMTPLILARYHRAKMRFTRDERVRPMAGALDDRLRALLPGVEPASIFFLGRIGQGPAPQARSTRKPLQALMAGGQ